MTGISGNLVRSTAPCLAVLVFAQIAGCSRHYHRTYADQDALSILSEKTQVPAWAPPATWSIEPSPESRLFDPTPIEDPILPDPRPRLHVYEIPDGIGRRTVPATEETPTMTIDVESVFQPASHSSDDSAIDRVLLARYVAQNEVDVELEELEVEPVTLPPRSLGVDSAVVSHPHV